MTRGRSKGLACLTLFKRMYFSFYILPEYVHNHRLLAKAASLTRRSLPIPGMGPSTPLANKGYLCSWLGKKNVCMFVYLFIYLKGMVIERERETQRERDLLSTGSFFKKPQ